ELEVQGADARAIYADGAFAGSPALTSNRAGRESAVYIGGAATQPTLDSLYRHMCEGIGLELLELPFELEVVRLEGTGNGELLMLLNHADRAQRIELAQYRWHDHIS